MEMINEIQTEIANAKAVKDKLMNEVKSKNDDGTYKFDNDAVQPRLDEIEGLGKRVDLLHSSLVEATKGAEREANMERMLASAPKTGSKSGDEDFAKLFLNAEAVTNVMRTPDVPIQGLAEHIWKNEQPVGTGDFETQRPFQGIVGAAVQPPTFLSLWPVTPVDKTKFDWLLQTTRTIAATGVAEGDAAPASDFVFTKQPVDLKRVRHITAITEDVLQSEMLLDGFIRRDMANGVLEAASMQVLRGTGDNNIAGVIGKTGVNNSTSAFATITGPAIVEKVFEMQRNVRTVGRVEPDEVAIHPVVFDMVRLARSTDGIYLYQHPAQAGPMTIGGKLAVQTTEFEVPAAAKVVAFTGAYGAYGRLWRMGDVTIQVTDSHGTQFASWENTMRAGAYMDVTLTRPAAFSKLTLS